MPKYQVQSPEGETYEITAPEGATEQEVLDYAKQQFGQKLAEANKKQNQQIMTHQLPQKEKKPITGAGKAFMRGLTTMPLGAAEVAENVNKRVPYYLQTELGKSAPTIRDARRFWTPSEAEQSGLGTAAEIAGSGISYLPILPTKAPASVLGKAVLGGGAAATAGFFSPTQGVEEMTPNEALLAKAKQSGFSGMVGFGLPLGIQAGKMVSHGVANVANKLTPAGGQRAARKTIIDLTGDKRAEIQSKLAKDYRLLTPAQSASEINNVPPAFIAMDSLARDATPTKYQATVATQQKTALDQLERLSGGRSKEQTSATVKLLEEARDKSVLPIKNRALTDAGNTNSLARMRTTSEAEANQLRLGAKRSVDDVRRLHTAREAAARKSQDMFPQNPAANLGTTNRTGTNRLPGRYSYAADLEKRADNAMSASANQSLVYGNQARNIEAQTQALDNMLMNVKPIHKDSLIASIDRRLADPEVYGAKEARDMLMTMRKEVEEIAKRSGKDGLIDPVALNAFRIHGPRAAINKVTSGQADPTATKKFLMGENINIKGQVDKVIEEAGGSEWKKYLNEYSRVSHLIDEVKMGGDLSAMYRNNPKSFIDAIRGDKPEAFHDVFLNNEGFKNITHGTGNYKQLAEGLERNIRKDELVEAGKPYLSGKISEQAKNELRLGLLHRPTVIANKITDILHGRATAQETQMIADLFATPEGKREIARMLGQTKFEQLGQKLSGFADQAFYPGIAGASVVYDNNSSDMPVMLGPAFAGAGLAGLLGSKVRDWWKDDKPYKEQQ